MANKKEPKQLSQSEKDKKIVDYIIAFRDYSEKRRQKFLDQSEFNWQLYNLKQPGGWRHKQKGQSRVFLPKVQTSVELLASTTFAALTARSNDWFDVDDPIEVDPVFDKDLIKNLLSYHLENADITVHLSTGMKNGGLDGLVTGKVGGKIKTIPRFSAEKTKKQLEGDKESKKIIKNELKRKILKRWCLAIDLVPYSDWYPDPDPNPSGPLGRIHEVERDLHELISVAKSEGVYEMDVIKQLQPSSASNESRRVKLRQKDETDTGMSFRKRVKVTEFWGTILDKDTGEVLHENCVAAVADDTHLIRKPEANPRIDGADPFVSSPLLQGPGVFPKALMTAPAMMNKIINEAKSLYIDAMVKEAGNITYTRLGMLEKPSQASGYIAPNTNLIVKDSAPSGVSPIEAVKLGQVPQDGLGMLTSFEQDYNEASLQNDLKLGQLPPASTKATSVQIADNSISGVFSTIMKVFEDKYIVPLLEKSWLEILDNMDNASFLDSELTNVIGLKKANTLMQMSQEERIARGASLGKFRVKGISGFVNRLREFQKLLQLLNVIGSNPALYQEFSKDYSLTRLVAEIVRNSGVREENIKLNADDKMLQQVNGRIGSIIESAMKQAAGGQQGANGAGAQPSQPQPKPPPDQSQPMTEGQIQ